MQEEILAVVPKSQDAEIRIVKSSFMGKPVIDVRVWFKNPQNEFVRSRKGFTVEERNFPRFKEIISSIEV